MKRQESGFTLLEMVVALVVLSLTALLGLEALRFSSRIWATATMVREVDVRDDRARALITQLLEQAYPPALQTGVATRPPMSSDGRSLTFSAPAPGFAGGSGLAYWWIEPVFSRGDSYVRLAWSLDTQRPSIESPQSEVLLPGVTGITWSFLDSATTGKPTWISPWASKPALPGAIRLEIAYPSGYRRTWIPLVVLPRANTPQECSFDQVSRRCRGMG
jgi:prepilin-type N-terminal cleavage/methylation domain-containing protein